MTTTAQLIAAEKQARIDGDAKLDARITALEAAAKPATPPASVIQVGPTDTPAAFLAAIANQSYNVVELKAGAYHWPSIVGNIARSPVTVRAAAPLTFFGDKATSMGGQFYFGLGGKASDIDFEFAGVTFDGYTLGSTGIVWMGAVQRMRFVGPTVQNSVGIGINSWACYLSVDNGLAPQHVAVDDWTVKGVNRSISALQVGHPPSSMSDIQAWRWTVDSVDIALYAYGNVNGLGVDDWAITNSKRDDRPGTVFFGPQVTGTFSNMRSDLGNLEQQGGMTRGAGNVGI